MIKKNFLFIILILGLLLSQIGFLQIIYAEINTSQRIDTTVLELDMSQRIESLIERLAGPGRAIAKVKLHVMEKATTNTSGSMARETQAKSEETTAIKGLSGIAVAKTLANKQTDSSDITLRGSMINKISIKILVDDKLDPKKIELIKETVPSWVGLDTARGDTLEVQPTPWKDSQLMPIEQLSVKQIEIGNKNIFVGIGIFLILLILAGVIVALIIGIIKIPKAKVEGAGGEMGMAGEGTERIIGSIEKLAKELGNIQLQGKGADKNTGGKVDRLLEDIKEILAHTQSTAGAGGGGINAGSNIDGASVDSQLGEIGNLLKKQMMGEKPTDKPFGLINSDLSGPEIISITEGEDEEILIHIIANVSPKKSAEILAALPEEKKLEIFTKVASIKETTPKIVQAVRGLLENKLRMVRESGGATHLAGSDVLAKILNVSSDEIIHAVIEKLEKDDPKLAKETRDKLFLFEDIALLDAKVLGVILNNLEKDTLKLALKHAPIEVLNKIFGAMTERGAAILKEDLEIMAMVTKESSKEAQKSILEKIRELEKKGNISLKRG